MRSFFITCLTSTLFLGQLSASTIGDTSVFKFLQEFHRHIVYLPPEASPKAAALKRFGQPLNQEKTSILCQFCKIEDQNECQFCSGINNLKSLRKNHIIFIENVFDKIFQALNREHQREILNFVYLWLCDPLRLKNGELNEVAFNKKELFIHNLNLLSFIFSLGNQTLLREIVILSACVTEIQQLAQQNKELPPEGKKKAKEVFDFLIAHFNPIALSDWKELNLFNIYPTDQGFGPELLNGTDIVLKILFEGQGRPTSPLIKMSMLSPTSSSDEVTPGHADRPTADHRRRTNSNGTARKIFNNS